MLVLFSLLIINVAASENDVYIQESDYLENCLENFACDCFTYDPSNKSCELLKGCNALNYDKCPRCISEPNIICNNTGLCEVCNCTMYMYIQYPGVPPWVGQVGRSPYQ